MCGSKRIADEPDILEKYREIYNKSGGVFEELKKCHKESPYTVSDHISQKSKVYFFVSR